MLFARTSGLALGLSIRETTNGRFGGDLDRSRVFIAPSRHVPSVIPLGDPSAFDPSLWR